MDLVIDTIDAKRAARRVEVVERKGLGHPDTLCDAVAERLSVKLCREYQSRFGRILHHNVDKILLCGGASRPEPGGGEVLEPIEIYVGGRATKEWRGESVPVDALAVDACREVFAEVLPELDFARHVKVIPRLRPGSGDLTSLFARTGGVPLANDTSCGAGFAPPTDLERLVLGVEAHLNARDTKRAHPEIGADIKVMGVRVDDRVRLTVGCAFVSRHVRDFPDYARKKAGVAALVEARAREITPLVVEATVNAADDLERGDVYLTVTGTSAEAGDDGEVGRGNRPGGLITPYRWMTMEAAAGKNPVSHVGKAYNVLAGRVAARLAETLPGARAAQCLLLSRIGRPVDDPQTAHVEIAADEPRALDRAAIEAVVRAELEGTGALREAILEGRIALF